jgi:hypothetical protein
MVMVLDNGGDLSRKRRRRRRREEEEKKNEKKEEVVVVLYTPNLASKSFFSVRPSFTARVRLSQTSSRVAKVGSTVGTPSSFAARAIFVAGLTRVT